MEQRIQQFHDDTKNIPKPPTAKTLKQMNTLKKFIFKNQVKKRKKKKLAQYLPLKRTLDFQIKKKISYLHVLKLTLLSLIEGIIMYMLIYQINCLSVG